MTFEKLTEEYFFARLLRPATQIVIARRWSSSLTGATYCPPK